MDKLTVCPRIPFPVLPRVLVGHNRNVCGCEGWRERCALCSAGGHRSLALLHLCTTVPRCPPSSAAQLYRKPWRNNCPCSAPAQLHEEGTSCRPPASWRWEQRDTWSGLPSGAPFTPSPGPQETSGDCSPDTERQAGASYRLFTILIIHRTGPAEPSPCHSGGCLCARSQELHFI